MLKSGQTCELVGLIDCGSEELALRTLMSGVYKQNNISATSSNFVKLTVSEKSETIKEGITGPSST